MDAPTTTRRLRSDEGAVAALVAILLVVIVALSALVIDVGYWYNVRRQLQAAADSAALAGCHVLIQGQDDGEVWDTVEEYAALNAVTPANVSAFVIDPSAGGWSDIGDDFVKVTVEMEARSFFAGVFGIAQTPIRAQARAEIAYAMEGRGLVPFAVPIIMPGEETDVIARAGGAEESLFPVGDDAYQGDITFYLTPADDEAHSVPVFVDVVNSQGILGEDFDGQAIARVLVRGDDFPLRDIWFDSQWLAPGDTTTLRMLTDPAVDDMDVRIKGPGVNAKVTMADHGSGVWSAPFTVPANVERYAVYEVEVELGIGKDSYGVEGKDPAVILMTRRSNAPVSRVDVVPTVFDGGGAHAIDLWVEFNRFEVSETADGPEYALKIDDGGGAESGNFGTVDFREVYAPPFPPYDNERTYDTGSVSGNWYEYALTHGWVGALHIGDAVSTYTGLSGGSTDNGLEPRLAADDRTFAEWIADGRTASPRLLYVPIVERLEAKANGRYIVEVVAFGAFYVEVYDKKESLLTGHFVEYVAPSGSTGGDPGPTELDTLTPRLVSEGLDF